MILRTMIFSIAVAVISAETMVTKRKGDNVTLNMTKPIHPVKNFIWREGKQAPVTPIAKVTDGKVIWFNGTRFANRLYIDIETASLTISNLNVNDSGTFLGTITMNTATLQQYFFLHVTDYFTISYDVLEGNNVTLDTGIKKLQKECTVIWTRGPGFGGETIANFSDLSTSIEGSSVEDLQLNPLTGSLTIVRVTKGHAGFYCLELLLRHEPYILRQFLVTTYEHVPKPHISTKENFTTHSSSQGTCHINCTVKNGPNVSLRWLREGKVVNPTSRWDASSELTLTLEIQGHDQVTYSCEAANPVSTEAVPVNSTQWCPAYATGPDKTNWTGVVWGLSVVVTVAVLCFISFCKWRQNRCQVNRVYCLDMRNLSGETEYPSNTALQDSNNEEEGQRTNSYGTWIVSLSLPSGVETI